MASVKVGKNTLWLVKASGRVIGPYADKQVGDLVRDHVLVALDEVSRPCGRWVYLRDEPTFAKVIEEVRVRGLRGSSDDSTTRNVDETQTVTTTPELDERTQEITQLPSNVVQDVMFRSIDDLKVDRAPSAKAFAFDADKMAKEQAAKNARWVWIFTALVVLFAFGFVMFQRFVAAPIKTKSVYKSSSAGAIDALESGRYHDALGLFSRAYALDPGDSSIYLDLGILKIEVANQTFEGRQLLEKLRGQASADQKHVLTGIGLAYLKDGDTQSAENNFRKALDEDPLFQPATIDLGAAAIDAGEWNKANDHLQVAVKGTPHDGAEYIMLAETLAHLYLAKKDDARVQAAVRAGVQVLNDFSDQSLDYALEARVASVYLQSLLGIKANIASSIDQILDSDFDLTEESKHNLFVYRDRVSWSRLSQWCSSVVRNMDPNPHASAFEAMCLAKAGQLADAERRMEDALAQAPKDALVQSIDAYVLFAENRNGRAQAALEVAVQNDPSGQWAQPRRLMARYCHKIGDFKCERDNWQATLVKSDREIAALTGLANLDLAQDHMDDAKKYLMSALSLSDNYIPLYLLQNALGGAGR